MGTSCSTLPVKLFKSKTAVETIDIRIKGKVQPHSDNIFTQTDHIREGSNLEQGERFGIVPDIQVDEQSMRSKSVITVSGVAHTTECLDPSVNIEQTRKLLELTRRNSRMESEIHAKQKLLQRIHSREGLEEGEGMVADDEEYSLREPGLEVTLILESAAEPAILSPADQDTSSLDVTALEERLSKVRRKSHCEYQKRLSLKRDSMKKKTPLTVTDDSADQDANNHDLTQVSS